MTDALDTLANLLIAAQRDAALTVPAAQFAGLTQLEALAVQHKVRAALGRDIPAAKIGIAADGGGLIGPIDETRFLPSGGTSILTRPIAGIEIEVAVRLGADLTPELADASDAELLGVIEEFLIAIEIIASRFDDRSAAGPWGPLADYMVTGGLVHGQRLPRDPIIDGVPIHVEIDGQTVFEGPAKHPFGSVLTPLRAAARVQNGDALPLRAGMFVTTGSLCPALIPVNAGSKVVARLGDHDIVWHTASA